MPTQPKRARARPSKRSARAATAPPRPDAQAVVAELRRKSSKSVKDGMARYGIPSDKAFGVPVGVMRQYAKELGRDHALAAALWRTGWYEARMLATFLDEPACVTPAQMERWCKDFDSWAIVDTACFHLFDRTPHAFAKVDAWSEETGEFQKRASFALLACLALHDRVTEDAPFASRLRLIEQAAGDERNFVKKGVSWALRGIGLRSPALHAASLELAARLAASDEPAARWVGKDAHKDLARRKLTKSRAAR